MLIRANTRCVCCLHCTVAPSLFLSICFYCLVQSPRSLALPRRALHTGHAGKRTVNEAVNLPKHRSLRSLRTLRISYLSTVLLPVGRSCMSCLFLQSTYIVPVTGLATFSICRKQSKYVRMTSHTDLYFISDAYVLPSAQRKNSNFTRWSFRETEK